MLIRETVLADAAGVLDVYRAAAENGTLSRDPDEYDLQHVADTLRTSLDAGVSLVAVIDARIAGEVHASRLPARRFSHVFGNLTAAVHPDVQGEGVGRALLAELLRRIDAALPPVHRVELMLQAGNPTALSLYSSLGFKEEGRLAARVRSVTGEMLDDVVMARLRDGPVG